MLKTKQQQILDILAGKKYIVKESTGTVESFRKCDNEYKELVPTTLSSGFKQVILHPGKVNVYVHNLVWLSFIGEFDENAIIRHKDGNKANNAIDNLYLDTISSSEEPETGRLSKDNVADIMKVMAAYPDRNAASIARELNLNYQAVRHTINKIKSGGSFIFNKQGKQVNNAKKEKESTQEQQGQESI